MTLSASPLTLGCRGVIRWCWNPSCLENSTNTLELNDGPLSESIRLGISLCANVLFIFSFVGLIPVEDVIFASGYLVLLYSVRPGMEDCNMFPGFLWDDRLVLLCVAWC